MPSMLRRKQTGIAAPMEIDLPEAELSLATGIWDMSTQRGGTLQVSVNPKTRCACGPGLQLISLNSVRDGPFTIARQSQLRSYSR
jgi:hypothetical protein